MTKNTTTHAKEIEATAVDCKSSHCGAVLAAARWKRPVPVSTCDDSPPSSRSPAAPIRIAVRPVGEDSIAGLPAGAVARMLEAGAVAVASAAGKKIRDYVSKGRPRGEATRDIAIERERADRNAERIIDSVSGDIVRDRAAFAGDKRLVETRSDRAAAVYLRRTTSFGFRDSIESIYEVGFRIAGNWNEDQRQCSRVRLAGLDAVKAAGYELRTNGYVTSCQPAGVAPSGTKAYRYRASSTSLRGKAREQAPALDTSIRLSDSSLFGAKLLARAWVRALEEAGYTPVSYAEEGLGNELDAGDLAIGEQRKSQRQDVRARLEKMLPAVASKWAKGLADTEVDTIQKRKQREKSTESALAVEARVVKAALATEGRARGISAPDVADVTDEIEVIGEMAAAFEREHGDELTGASKIERSKDVVEGRKRILTESGADQRSTARALVRAFGTRASIEVETTAPGESHSSSLSSLWIVDIRIEITSNGAEDRYAADRIAASLRELSGKDPYVRLFAGGGKNRPAGTSVNQHGPPPYGQKSGAKLDEHERQMLERQKRGTYLQPRLVASTSSLGDALSAARAIVDAAWLILDELGYRVTKTWAEGANGPENLLEILEKKYSFSAPVANRFYDDAALVLGADTVEMLREELNSDARFQTSNHVGRLGRLGEYEDALRAVALTGSLPEQVRASMSAEVFHSLRSTERLVQTAVALREWPNEQGMTLSESLAIEAGLSHATQMFRAEIERRRSEATTQEKRAAEANIVGKVPSIVHAGTAYAAGIRRVSYQRIQYDLARVEDKELTSWFGWKLATVDEEEVPPAIHQHLAMSELVTALDSASKNPAFRVFESPEVGSGIVGMRESPGSETPVTVAEHAWAIGTAPAELVGECTVTAVDESKTTSRVLSVRSNDTGQTYRIEQRTSGPGQAILAWTAASRQSIDSRDEATRSEAAVRSARVAEVARVPAQPKAAEPPAAPPAPVVSAAAGAVPAELAALGFLLPSSRKVATKAAELSIEAKSAMGAGTTVLVVHGRATYAAKELLKKLGFRYEKLRGGIAHGWWKHVPGIDAPRIPYEYVRASVALSKDYKLDWPVSGALSSESTVVFETAAEEKAREQGITQGSAPQKFSVDFKDGIFFTIDAPREAWSSLKPLGWNFNAAPRDCQRKGCRPCALGMGQCYFTSDPAAAKGVADLMTEKARAALVVEEAAVASSRATDAEIDCGVPVGITLYGYQRAGIKYASSRSRVLFADEMGLGKTPQSIVTCACDASVKTVLVIVPASLRRNWTREVGVFCARPSRVVRLRDTVSKRKSETKEQAIARLNETNVAAIMAPSPDMTWVIVGYEEAMSVAGGALDGIPFDAVIVDEAQAIKNAKAQRTKRAMELWERARARKIMLTGTPIENNLDELYTLVSMLEPQKYPPGGAFPKALKYNAARRKELELEMRKSFMVRRLKSEVLLDLPEKRWSMVELDGPELDDARAAWSDVKEALGLSDDPSGDKLTPLAVQRAELEAQIEVARAMKDRKLVRDLAEKIAKLSPGSVDFADISRVRSLTGRAKVSLALEFISTKLESMPAEERSLVVWAHHDEVAEALAAGIRSAGYSVEIANGKRDPETRGRIVADFQAGLLNVAVCTILSMGTGHTMTRANEAVFVELAWTPAKISQAEDRIHRIGQKRGVSITYLYAGDTLDVRMLAILQQKEILSETTLDNEDEMPVARDRSAEILARVNAAASGVGQRASDDEIAAIERDWTKQVARSARVAVRRTEAIYQYTKLEKATLQAAMEQLRGSCDGAKRQDECGFAAPDVRIGWSLADIPAARWTDELATLAHKLSIKYRGQLGGEVLERTRRPISTEERLDD